MSKAKLTVAEWLEWAERKYDAAQERYAYGGSSATMDSYSCLVNALSATAQRQRECRIADMVGSWGICSDCDTLVNTECVAEGGTMLYCPHCGAKVVRV